jgi:hypothetical protein
LIFFLRRYFSRVWSYIGVKKAPKIHWKGSEQIYEMIPIQRIDMGALYVVPTCPYKIDATKQ